MTNQHQELFRRQKTNPILSANNWPYPINSVFNPGATLLPDGTTLLLCRVEDRRGHSHLTVARSTNGVDNWQIESQPTFRADPKQFPEELWGIEDPRITEGDGVFPEDVLPGFAEGPKAVEDRQRVVFDAVTAAADAFSAKVVAALRHQFGGHAVMQESGAND